jgi:GNAT superfamily N-acetyltransferase
MMTLKKFESIKNLDQPWTRMNAVFKDLYVGYTTKAGKTPAVWLDYASKIRPDGIKSVVVENIYCTQGHRGKGYGTALMQSFMTLTLDPTVETRILIPNCNQHSATMADKLGFILIPIEGEDGRYEALFTSPAPVPAEVPIQDPAPAPTTIAEIKAVQAGLRFEMKEALEKGKMGEVARLSGEFNTLNKQIRELEWAARPSKPATPPKVRPQPRNWTMDHAVKAAERREAAKV